MTLTHDETIMLAAWLLLAEDYDSCHEGYATLTKFVEEGIHSVWDEMVHGVYENLKKNGDQEPV